MKRLKNKFNYVILLLTVLFLSLSCNEWDDEGIDFRNYLRDKHPYSVIKKIDLGALFNYQVNDTIKGQIWIYTSYRTKNSVKGVRVDCP